MKLESIVKTRENWGGGKKKKKKKKKKRSHVTEDKMVAETLQE